MLHIASHRFNTTFLWLFIFVLTLCFTIPTLAAAQAPSFVANSIYLESAPQYPEPNSTVTVSLNDYSVNALGATISWFINGEEQTATQNERSIVVPTHTLGTQEVVKVVLSRTGALPLSHTLTLNPVVIDIILEADTYVPSFYKGRALPSQESSVRAIALVHDTSGGIKSEYTYKWSAGTTVLLGGPVKGKYALDYLMPRYDDNELTVEVFNAKGVSIGKKTILVSPAETQLHFYEYSSLRGLSERTAANPLPLISDETTIFGEPYFINTAMEESGATFTWKVDGVPAASDTSVPNAITLAHSGDTGKSLVSLSIITKSRIPQYVMETLQLIF